MCFVNIFTFRFRVVPRVKRSALLLHSAIFCCIMICCILLCPFCLFILPMLTNKHGDDDDIPSFVLMGVPNKQPYRNLLWK